MHLAPWPAFWPDFWPGFWSGSRGGNKTINTMYSTTGHTKKTQNTTKIKQNSKPKQPKSLNPLRGIKHPFKRAYPPPRLLTPLKGQIDHPEMMKSYVWNDMIIWILQVLQSRIQIRSQKWTMWTKKQWIGWFFWALFKRVNRGVKGVNGVLGDFSPKYRSTNDWQLFEKQV